MYTKLLGIFFALLAFSAPLAAAESTTASNTSAVTAQKRFVMITFDGLSGSIPGFVVSQNTAADGTASMILAPVPYKMPQEATQHAVKVISALDGRRLAATDNPFIVLQSSTDVAYVALMVPALLVDAGELEVANDFDPEAALLVITADKAVTASAKDLQFLLEYDSEASFAGAVIMQSGRFFGVVGYVNNSGVMTLDVATYPAIRASVLKYYEQLLQQQEEEERMEREFRSRQIRI